jgi:hypothetical protein
MCIYIRTYVYIYIHMYMSIYVFSLDVEKDRPHLEELLPLCDMIFTNKEFPENYFHNKLADEYISKVSSFI